MCLFHEPWLVPHWFLSVKRQKLCLSFFFYTLVSPVLQEVVFREESEKNGLGVAPRSCFGVQGGCFLSSLSEGSAPPHPPNALRPSYPTSLWAQIRVNTIWSLWNNAHKWFQSLWFYISFCKSCKKKKEQHEFRFPRRKLSRSNSSLAATLKLDVRTHIKVTSHLILLPTSGLMFVLAT